MPEPSTDRAVVLAAIDAEVARLRAAGASEASLQRWLETRAEIAGGPAAAAEPRR